MTTLNRKVRDAGKAAQAGLDTEAVAHCAAAFFLTWKLMKSSATMQYWLMKSEPDEVSIDDALAAPGSIVPWTGVRNYQARNFMRDAMRPGDGVLFYHSSCALPGVAGLAEVASTAYPDPTQFDPGSTYFDPKATRVEPRWLLVDVRALKKTRLLGLSELRAQPDLAEMQILRRGNRLSITPVSPHEWRCIMSLLTQPAQ